MSVASTIDRETSLPWPQRLISMLERQHALLDQLDELAGTQQALIAGGSADALLELLGRRQTVIDEFTGGQSQLTELTRGIDERLPATAPPQRERIQALIDTIGKRLVAVLDRDERDQAALRSGRAEVQREMSALGAARQARSAYVSAHPGPRSRFADRQG